MRAKDVATCVRLKQIKCHQNFDFLNSQFQPVNVLFFLCVSELRILRISEPQLFFFQVFKLFDILILSQTLEIGLSTLGVNSGLNYILTACDIFDAPSWKYHIRPLFAATSHTHAHILNT